MQSRAMRSGDDGILLDGASHMAIGDIHDDADADGAEGIERARGSLGGIWRRLPRPPRPPASGGHGAAHMITPPGGRDYYNRDESYVTMLPYAAFISRLMKDYHGMTAEGANREWIKAKSNTQVRREVLDGVLCLAYKGVKRYVLDDESAAHAPPDWPVMVPEGPPAPPAGPDKVSLKRLLEMKKEMRAALKTKIVEAEDLYMADNGSLLSE